MLDYFIDLYTFSFTVFVGFILICFLNYYRRRKLPPGSYGLPIFGSVGFFREFKRRRHLVLSDLARQHGNIFSVYAGTQLVVFLNGYDVIHEAFIKNASVFSGRPNWLPSLQIGLSEGNGLVWQDAIHASAARKFAMQALREFGLGKTTLQEKILQEVDTVSDILQHNLGQPFRLKSTLKKAATNVIHEIVFSERFDYDDPRIENLIFLIDEFFKGGIFIPKNFMPRIISKCLPTNEREYQRKQRVIADLKQYIYNSISEHEASFDRDSIRDFIDLYIDGSVSSESCKTPWTTSKGEIFRIILDLFLAGSETTASTLEWCFMFMVKYPHVQEKCFREISQMKNSQSNTDVISWSCRTELPYIEATLAEVQRLATIVPLGLPHATSQDTNLQGYVIPKDTIVFANLYSCAMDASVWDNAEELIPERHLDGRGKFTANEKLLPFSIGPRMCLGDSMAKIEIFLMFTNLLWRYKFTEHGIRALSVTNIREDHPVSSAAYFEVTVTER